MGDDRSLRQRRRGISKEKDDSVKPTEKQHTEETRTVRHRSLWSHCVGVCKYAVLFLLIPPFLNYAALQREATHLKPDGQLYDVGQGRKMFLGCQGKGVPTVILDAPTGMNSDVWVKVQSAVAKLTKVCVYDRAGLGYSERYFKNNSTNENSADKHWQGYTVESMADDLHRLITGSSEQPRPLLLVGSEMGALVARFYAQMHESDVSDILLIDPLGEDLFMQDSGVWSQFWFHRLVPSQQILQLSASLGVSRLALILGLMDQHIEAADIPQTVVQRQKYLLCQPRHLSTVVDEHYFINDSFSQMRTMSAVRSLSSSIQVTVLTGNYYDEQLPSSLNKAWAKSVQKLLSSFSASSSHVVINGADHHMLYKNPQAVTEHIRRLVRRWRTRNSSKSS